MAEKRIGESNSIAYEPVSEELANKILNDFERQDSDSSMRVSFDELSNAIIKEYVANEGKKNLALQEGEAINNLLNYYRERAKEFDSSEDGAINIDEYETMLRDKIQRAVDELKKSKSSSISYKDIVSAESVCDSSAVKFEKAFDTAKKSAEIVDRFVEE